MAQLELHFASGESSLSVRHFVVEEGISRLFEVQIVARSPNDNIDIESIVGQPAVFRILHGETRTWTGIVRAMSQTRVEPTGLSTYALTLVPNLWALTERRNNRLFQHISIPDIVDRLLHEWKIEPVWRVQREAYPGLELRVQYDETDHAFLSRLLEEAGISYFFQEDTKHGSRLVFHDAPQKGEPRAIPIPFVDSTTQVDSGRVHHVTAVQVDHEVRPGRYTIRDYDFRRPAFPLFGEAPPADEKERGYEHYRYLPGAMLVEGATPGASIPTPVADDQGRARFDQRVGAAFAGRSLEGVRASKRVVRFETNVLELAPGTVFSMIGHTRLELLPTKRLLVTQLSLAGAPGEEWTVKGRAHFVEEPYRPKQTTAKPRIHGIQSAVVTGPEGEEIHTDEFGRVRVQFHWDREGRRDEHSSTWMRVSQGWAGGGYGLFTVPRIGNEVLVGFLDGDPDNPLVVGRVFNAIEQVPHKLPENKTVSTWKSASSPRSDGFNEIRFEDAAGREHLYMQAEKDHDKLVKHDEMNAVGHDLARLVQNDESITIGHDRHKLVHFSETETTGLHRTATVGVNRNTTIGADDSTLVGSKYSLSVARGLSARLPAELSSLMNGPLSPVLAGPVTPVLGIVPGAPLGGALDVARSLSRGPLSALHGTMSESFQSVLGVMEGYADDPGPPPTSFEMVDRKITFTTGEASIILDGPNITIFAEGNIMLHAQKNIALLGDNEAAVAAQERLLLSSKRGDVILQGGPMVMLNPFAHPAPDPSAEASPDEFRAPKLDELPEICPRCGEPMVGGVCTIVARQDQ